jgi:iron complex outermembrane receptor protein
MKKGYLNKSLLMTVLITGATVATMGIASAATVDSFELDPMMVTAQKMETSDLKTASSVTVITRKDIERTGAVNAYRAIQNTIGVQPTGLGPNGVAMSTMTSDIIMRGSDKGTLVLLDGVPMNQDGKYNLEDIKADNIEKIEIVRGGGSVLYGSEASGGVINIITKDGGADTFKTQMGNYGRKSYYTHVGDDKFSVSAGYDERGEFRDMSAISYSRGKYYRYEYLGGKNKSLNWKYKINDNLTFIHDYVDSTNLMSKYYFTDSTGNGKYVDSSGRNVYTKKDNTANLVFDDGTWKANLSYGIQERNYYKNDYKDLTTGNSAYTLRSGHNTNVDIQKRFNIDDDVLLIGGAFKREELKINNLNYSTDSNYKRDMMSVYASYDWAMGDDFNTIINMRETWARNSSGTQIDNDTGETTNVSKEDVSKFTPEIQFIKQIDDDSSVYAKAGKSFRMPNLTQLYGSNKILANPSLKPETGTHYEIGYKWNTANSAWRLAAYHYKIVDSMTASESGDDWVYTNEDIKNTGLELSVATKHTDKLSTNFGISYGNPQKQSSEDYGDNDWHDYLGKVQLNGGVNYITGKLESSLTFDYIGKRTRNKNYGKNKDQFFTDLHFGYSPTKNHKFTLDVNNLFDREDIVSNSKSIYYTMGRNFLLGYESNF